MESIEKLPVDKDRSLSQDEIDVLNSYFGDVDTSESTLKSFTADENGEFSPKIKLIGYATILFIVLNNPITDGVLNNFPSFESPLMRIAIKAMLFAVILFLL